MKSKYRQLWLTPDKKHVSPNRHGSRYDVMAKKAKFRFICSVGYSMGIFECTQSGQRVARSVKMGVGHVCVQ